MITIPTPNYHYHQKRMITLRQLPSQVTQYSAGQSCHITETAHPKYFFFIKKNSHGCPDSACFSRSGKHNSGKMTCVFFSCDHDHSRLLDLFFLRCTLLLLVRLVLFVPYIKKKSGKSASKNNTIQNKKCT